MEINWITISLLLWAVLTMVESILLFMIFFGTGGAALTLARAKLQDKLLAIVELDTGVRELQVPKVEEGGYLDVKGIGSILPSIKKIIPLKGGIRSIWVSSKFAEGITAADVQSGYHPTPSMILRANERTADALALKKMNQNPQNKVMNVALVLAIIIGVGIVGYLLFNAVQNIQWCNAQERMLANMYTTTTLNLKSVADQQDDGLDTGIYRPGG